MKDILIIIFAVSFVAYIVYRIVKSRPTKSDDGMED